MRSMEIRTASLKELYQILQEPVQGERTAALLCSSYPIREDVIVGKVEWLALRFDDTAIPRGPDSFTHQMGEDVRRFWDGLQGRTQTLYVCCDSGESRSAAIAAAILRRMGENDKPIWRNPRFHPNPLVYRVQCEAFGVGISTLGLRFRIWVNHREFRRAVRKGK